jgi:predicted DsbA family dithiol-disulfide isomerase
MKGTPLEIDIFHDTVCPWCRIGKRHLELALERWDGPPAMVRYHTFFLNADIPPEGREFRPYMIEKGGGRMTLEQFFDRPRNAGAAVGLNFAFERIEYAPNTLLSHRLIASAPEAQQEPLIDAIYAAYFEHGRNIGDIETLLDIAGETGLDRNAAAALLKSDAGLDAIREDVELARQIGITGVPFFIFGGRYALSGAQPPELMLQAIQAAYAERDAGSA